MTQQSCTVIDVVSDKCVNCHACIAVCSIRYCNDGSGKTVHINHDRCIGCGRCLEVCTHGARVAIDDTEAFFTDVARGEKLVAIVAPAAATVFPGELPQLIGWLKSLGVAAVFDVSFGAELTVKSYVEYHHAHPQDTIIAQPCPSIVSYIEIYHPELLPALIPIDSPMVHTMKMIREYYPAYRDHRIVALSPCIAKKLEFAAVGIGDYNVTFAAVREYLATHHIDLSSFPAADYENPPAERAVLFSAPGGLLRTMERWHPDIRTRTRQIEGQQLVYRYLEHLPEMIDKGMAPLLVDCLNCEKGCNGGTGAGNADRCIDELDSIVEARKREMQQRYRDTAPDAAQARENVERLLDQYWRPGLYDRQYTDRGALGRVNIPTPEELQAIFELMEKYTEADIFNCCHCGYESCEGMAIAIHNGLNRPENCHHYVLTRLEAKKQLELAYQLAEEANLMKSEFLANTSHELRTPLNSIIGSLNLILDGLCDSPEEEREFISNAYQSSRHLLSLINDVLDIAKIEAGKLTVEPCPTSIATVFQEVKSLVHVQAANRSLELAFSISDADDLVAYVEPAKLKQVLINLVGNSIKFTPQGTIRVLAQSFPDKGYIMIQVSDTGIGIAPEKQTKLFRAFVQADGSTTRQYGGSGLGLAISHRLIELMDGSISLYSAGEGCGTTITLNLPLWKPDEHDLNAETGEVSTSSPASTNAPGGEDRMLVLVVEDDAPLQRVLTEMLQMSGFSAVGASTADEAWMLVMSMSPDAITLDINLPDTPWATLHSGWELLKLLSERAGHIPVIIVSGDEEAIRSLRVTHWVCPTNILMKPVERETLISTIDRVTIATNRPLNILIADDDPQQRLMIGKLLPSLSYHVTMAKNGEEALEIIRRDPAFFDLLLLDLMMPKVDGYQVLRELKLQRLAPELPVIVVTNYPEPKTKEEALLLKEQTVLTVLSKPVVLTKPAVLLDKLTELLKQKVMP